LPGTEGGVFPTFSPDGRWLAFQEGSRLKKVRLGESRVVTLVDSLDQVQGGVAWLDDGTLIYPGPGLEGKSLLRISAEGGASTVALDDKSLAGLGVGLPAGRSGGRGADGGGGGELVRGCEGADEEVGSGGSGVNGARWVIVVN
jgi:hypothetical protein